jgi:hypothetical protein
MQSSLPHASVVPPAVHAYGALQPHTHHRGPAFDPLASAPPFATYTRPQRSVTAEEQLEEQALSNALAESLRDHQQRQQQQSQRRQPQADTRPNVRIDVESVSGAVQVHSLYSGF